jgi:hypothetical protein
MVVISIAGVLIFMHYLGKKADRDMLLQMRSDGLTEEAIQVIVGTKGYSKLLSAQKR